MPSAWANPTIRPVPTERELAVLEAVALTGSYRGAAIQLGIAETTVRNHLHTIRRMWGCTTTIQAYRIAVERGLLARA